MINVCLQDFLSSLLPYTLSLEVTTTTTSKHSRARSVREHVAAHVIDIMCVKWQSNNNNNTFWIDKKEMWDVADFANNILVFWIWIVASAAVVLAQTIFSLLQLLD